jgi:hypothetical protein
MMLTCITDDESCSKIKSAARSHFVLEFNNIAVFQVSGGFGRV